MAITLAGIIEYCSALFPRPPAEPIPHKWYTAEYDENSEVWLLDHVTNSRTRLLHGMHIAITEIKIPSYLEVD